MKRVFINPYLAFLVIAVIAAGATELVLHTISNLEQSLPTQQLADLP
jgi:hypothetical protein